jgi:hypothetical protein
MKRPGAIKLKLWSSEQVVKSKLTTFNVQGQSGNFCWDYNKGYGGSDVLKKVDFTTVYDCERLCLKVRINNKHLVVFIVMEVFQRGSSKQIMLDSVHQ